MIPLVHTKTVATFLVGHLESSRYELGTAAEGLEATSVLKILSLEAGHA